MKAPACLAFAVCTSDALGVGCGVRCAAGRVGGGGGGGGGQTRERKREREKRHEKGAVQPNPTPTPSTHHCSPGADQTLQPNERGRVRVHRFFVAKLGVPLPLPLTPLS